MWRPEGGVHQQEAPSSAPRAELQSPPPRHSLSRLSLKSNRSTAPPAPAEKTVLNEVICIVSECNVDLSAARRPQAALLMLPTAALVRSAGKVCVCV